MLGIEDCAAIAGMLGQTLRNFVRDGFVHPAVPGGGPGIRHLFSPTQALGIAVAEAVRRSPQRCAQSYLGLIVEAFGRLSEAEVRRQLKSPPHAFAFAVDTGGGAVIVWERPDPYGVWVDCRPLWAAVLERMTERAKAPVLVETTK